MNQTTGAIPGLDVGRGVFHEVADDGAIWWPVFTDRATRLLCARLYMYGLPVALLDLFRLLGRPCAGYERSVGVDRRRLMFHCWQVILLSASVLWVCLLLYFFAPAQSVVALVLLQAVLLSKIAIVNPWLSRRGFGPHPRPVRLPIIGDIAEALTNRLAPWDVLRGQNAIYFGDDRPFVGYGAEVNAWTVVVDTRAPSKSPFSMADPSPAGPDAPAELYDAVETKARTLSAAGIIVDRVVCVDGRSVGEAPGAPRLRRPPPVVEERFASEIDLYGDRGRRYLLLTGSSRHRDVLVTQFVRFSKVGHLIFCEFASHLVPPVTRTVSHLDTVFGYHPVVFALMGVALYVAAGVASTMVGPALEALLWLSPAAFVQHLSNVAVFYPQYVIEQITGGWFAYRIVGCTLVVILLILAFQAVRWLSAIVLFALSLKGNYGLASSYRERWATLSRLRYFELQEAVRLLKVHEQVLLSAVIEWLDQHGIDSSTFKETVTAFINQGVINSGQIGGNVATKIGSMVVGRRGKGRARRKAAA